jgi:predicted dehydrogenase
MERKESTRGREGQPMKTAIVGTGGIARVHARAVRQLGGELVAICGRSLDSARAFGLGEPYENLEQMLRDHRPDVLHVCTPNHLHLEHVLAAFRHGAHAICEKPLAASGDEAARLVEAAERAKRIGAVNYNYRGYPLIEILRDRVGRGEFGALRRIGGAYLCDDTFGADRYLWHFTPGSVGPAYALMDLGVHWFDLAEYVSGLKIVEITAQFSTHQPRRIWSGRAGEGPRPAGVELDVGRVAIDHTLDEQADLLVRFGNGAAGAVTISGVSVGHPNGLSLSFDGAEAGFDWEQEAPNYYRERRVDGAIVRQRRAESLPADRGSMSMLPAGQPEGYLDAFRNVIDQAWSAMRGGTAPFPSFADGLRGVALVEAAVASARDGRGVAVKAARG